MRREFDSRKEEGCPCVVPGVEVAEGNPCHFWRHVAGRVGDNCDELVVLEARFQKAMNPLIKQSLFGCAAPRDAVRRGDRDPVEISGAWWYYCEGPSADRPVPGDDDVLHTGVARVLWNVSCRRMWWWCGGVTYGSRD